ncbi:MAG TPA: hypothetical protein VGD13_03355 [Xanthobacteraceae bacterium]|jgi:Tfp pilus assembly protein PilX
MASTDEYRRLAADCLRIAHESHNPKDRALLLRMAESWIRLAERAEVRKSEGETFSGRERSEAADHRIRDAGAPDERGTNGS